MRRRNHRGEKIKYLRPFLSVNYVYLRNDQSHLINSSSKRAPAVEIMWRIMSVFNLSDATTALLEVIAYNIWARN